MGFLDDIGSAATKGLSNIGDVASADVNAGIADSLGSLKDAIPTVSVDLGGVSPPSPMNPRPSPPIAALQAVAPQSPAPSRPFTIHRGAGYVPTRVDPAMLAASLAAAAPGATPAQKAKGWWAGLSGLQKGLAAAGAGLAALLLIRR